jgi:hypothetical protein
MKLRRKNPGVLRRVAIGAAAGFSGTMAVRRVMSTAGKLLPGAPELLDEDAAEGLVKKAKHLAPKRLVDRIPAEVEKLAARSLHFGYGMVAGALYAVARPRGGHALIDGTLLGLVVWGVGYAGLLPALDLMPPLTKQKPKQIVIPAVQHAVFGIMVVAAYDRLVAERG